MGASRPLGTIAASAAIGLYLLAGCGGGSDSQTDTASPAPAPPSAPSGSAKVPAVGDGAGGVKLTRLGRFDSPVHLTQPPAGGALYVVEQGGKVRVLEGGRVLQQPFLDVSDKITSGGEQGLLSLAFAPDYAKSGLLYVDYTDTNGDTHVVEYRRSKSDPLRADPSSARDVLVQEQPFSNHNGGLVVFGPGKDLYIGFGDGGSEGDPQRNGQDPATFLGKILRIDPARSGAKPYTVPNDNPFVGKPGAKPEIYVYGVRNPWRFSFDRKTGALLIGDVGQDTQEEVDDLPAGKAAGANLGWSAFEGTDTYNDDQSAPGAIAPVLTYSHDDGRCSITGGYVVRDPNLSSLYGRYLYADFCTGDLRSFTPSPSKATDDRSLGLTVPSPSSFGEDADGHIYALSIEGDVYRLDPR